MSASFTKTHVTSLRGNTLLNEPLRNKGTAFTKTERQDLGLEGLLPTTIEMIDQQLQRRRVEFDRLHDDMERHIFLRGMQDDNEVLFYAFLQRHLDEMLPLVYTPTVGAACQQFSHIYRRPRGTFISYPDRDRIAAQLDAVDRDIDVIVVTDGERILGLGDQGIGGMGIPIGKLSLYTVVGGIDPARTLPIVLDVGTNNVRLRDDPLYVGWRHDRIAGDDYRSFIDDFVTAVKARFPGVLLQWEDFAQENAAPLLDTYQREILSFNDDIQGTAAVALAAVEAAIGATRDSLADQRICIVGAGSAGTGIGHMIRRALLEVGVEDISKRLYLTDRQGLLHDGRTDLTEFQTPFSVPEKAVADWAGADGWIGLEQIIERAQPTVLLGVSGAPGLFTEPLVRTMASYCERPIIMPMSNPTSRAEATPADLFAWTDGRALVATGSPFDPVQVGDRLVEISQANNVYVFPGLGLGAIISGATRVTDSMMVAAAEAVAAEAGLDGFEPDNGILPPILDTPQMSQRVAMAVAQAACRANVAPAATDAELAHRLADYRWAPAYPTLVAAERNPIS